MARAAGSRGQLDEVLRLLQIRAELAGWVRDAAWSFGGLVLVSSLLVGGLAGLVGHLALWWCAPATSRRARWGGAALIQLGLWGAWGWQLMVQHPGMYRRGAWLYAIAESGWPWLGWVLLVVALGLVGAWRRRPGGPLAQSVEGPARRAGAAGFGLAEGLSLVALLFVLQQSWWLRALPAEPISAPLGPLEGSLEDIEHVVIIGLDALRPDHISGLGYERPTSPHLDRFLEGARVWTRAYTPLARTGPSWISLLTGALPVEHGLEYDLPAPTLGVPWLATLPTLLGERGWRTAWWIDDSRFFPMEEGIGFQERIQPPPGVANFVLGARRLSFPILALVAPTHPAVVMAPLISGNQAFARQYVPEGLIRRAAGSLRRSLEGEAPSFTAIHLCTLHAPGERRFPYTRLFGQNGWRGSDRFRYRKIGLSVPGLEEERDPDEPPVMPDEGRWWPGQPRYRDRFRADRAVQERALYDAGIVDLDRQLGALLRTLEESPAADRTLVIVWSDHGEALAEEGLPYPYRGPNHGFHGYSEASDRILLAIRGPGIQPGRDDRLVRAQDVGATLAAILGVAWPQARDGRALPGLGLESEEQGSRIHRGQAGITRPSYWPPGHLRYGFELFIEGYDAHDPHEPVFLRARWDQQVRDATDRWVQRDGVRGVARPQADGGWDVAWYDMEADPDGRSRLSEEDPRVVELWPELWEFLDRAP